MRQYVTSAQAGPAGGGELDSVRALLRALNRFPAERGGF
jgi:hypothetical protein